MAGEIQYANWWSKLLFGKAYDNQFVIPVPSPRPMVAAMEWLQRRYFDQDLSHLPIDRPIFIVGLPRSGTSKLYNLMAAHEQAAFVTTSMNAFPTAPSTIEWARKRFNFNIRGERFLQDSIDADFGSPSEPAMLWGKWTGRDAESLYWPEQRLADLPPGRREEIHADLRRVIASFGPPPAGASHRRFVTKYPVFQTELKLIQEVFPDAHFIHIVRDGRMVANSLVKLNRLINEQLAKIRHPDLKQLVPYPRIRNLESYIKTYGSGDIRCTAHVWQDSIDVVREARPSLKHFIEVRHEDLMADPRKELARLFDFAGLPWPAADNTEFQREFDGIGKLRHKNDYGQFDEVERIAMRTLKEYGYA